MLDDRDGPAVGIGVVPHAGVVALGLPVDGEIRHGGGGVHAGICRRRVEQPLKRGGAIAPSELLRGMVIENVTIRDRSKPASTRDRL